MIFLWALIGLFSSLVLSEPVQYCKHGSSGKDINFCMGMLLHSNISTHTNDLYLTMSVTRPNNSISLLGTQGILGWRHHVMFVRLHHQTWWSHAHIWLGRLLMAGGWLNVMTGLVLRGYSGLCLGAMGAFIGTEVLVMGGWLYWKARGKAEKLDDDGKNYFAVGDDEYEDETSTLDGQDEEVKSALDRS